MKKRILSVIITVCLLLAILSTTVFAEAAKALIAMDGYTISFFNIDDTTAITSTASTSTGFLNSAVYVNKTLYFANSETNLFGTINSETGAMTTISSGNPYHLISYNVLNSKFYGLSAGYNSSLYTIDPETGDATFVVGISTPESFILDFTITNDGRFIAIDTKTHGLLEINPITGVTTSIIPANFTVNYGQGISTDRSTNTVYWAAFNADSFCGELYSVNLTTNTLTFIGSFANQVACFAIMSEYEKLPPEEINEVDEDGNSSSFETLIIANDTENVTSIEWKIFNGTTDVTSLWNISCTNTGLNSVKATSSAVITDNGYSTVDGKTRTLPADFTVVAVITDGAGNESQRSWTVKINDIDRSPVQPTVTVKKNGEIFSETTGHVHTGDSLTASVSNSADIDGDTITYEYRWTNSGTGRTTFTESKAPGEISTLSNVAAGEIWSLDVRAFAKPSYVTEDDASKYRSEWVVAFTNISTHIFDVETVSDDTKKTDATCTSKAVCYKSCSCGEISTTDTFEYGTVLNHSINTDEWLYDETGHWHTCDNCSETSSYKNHIPGATATESTPQVCTVCGYVISPVIPSPVVSSPVVSSPVIPKTGNESNNVLTWAFVLFALQGIMAIVVTIRNKEKKA